MQALYDLYYYRALMEKGFFSHKISVIKGLNLVTKGCLSLTFLVTEAFTPP